jgi:putrescine transport system substrate-binding protein
MVRTSTFLFAALLCAAASAAEEPVLNVYNWADYVAPDTIRNFEREYGIRVNYDLYDSTEVVEAKLLAGSTGYDVVFHSYRYSSRLIPIGVYQPLDPAKLDRSDNLDQWVLAKMQAYDPGNRYGVPYMWGTTGFAYNTAMINERMPDAPVDSWSMLFDPEVVKNFADCGVTLLDAPTEGQANMLGYLGRDPNSESDEDLKAFEDRMMGIRPSIRYFHSSQNINDIANGEICVAMGWSGDMFIAMDRAAEADQGIELEYVIPKEGAVIWFDMLAIPTDAPHPENAHLFLNYTMRPEVAAGISNYVWYANANEAATELVDEEVSGNPSIYPPDEVKQKLFPDLAESPAHTRKLTRSWTRIKTGQ